MNKLTKSLVAAGLLAGISAPALADGVSGNVSLVSDYVWRGVSQSNNNPTMQGGMDYEKGAFSVGTWGSSTDTNGTEIDLYGAYNFGPVAVGAIYYYYPGGGSFTEVNVGGDVGPVSLLASYATDVTGNPYYVEASYSHSFGKVSLDLHGGYGESYVDTSGNAVFDYSVGLSGSAGGVDLAAVYAYTGADLTGTGDSSSGKAYVSISKSM
jgi:uncharacterized protein (TIGR02001 family)